MKSRSTPFFHHDTKDSVASVLFVLDGFPFSSLPKIPTARTKPRCLLYVGDGGSIVSIFEGVTCHQ